MGRNVIQFKDKDNNVYDVKDVVARTTKADVIINNTESAPITSVKDAMGDMPVKTLEVQIDPVQDLHGYDNPWPGGGGKNLYGNGDWTISSARYKRCNLIKPIPAGDYTISSLVTSTDTDATTCRVSFYDSNDTALTTVYLDRNTRSSATFTLTDECVAIFFYTSNDATHGAGDSAEYKDIQIESGSTATEYAPFENICPISGRTSADVTRTGKNLLNHSTSVEGYSINASGVITALEGFAYSQLIPVKKGETYTFSFVQTATPSTNYRIHGYDANGNWIEQIGSYATVSQSTGKMSFSVTVPNTITFIRISYAPSRANSFMLEEGSSASAYEAFGEEIYTTKNAEDGKYINADGTIGTNADFLYTDLLPVDSGNKIYATMTNPGRTARYTRVHGYNESGTWVQQIDATQIQANSSAGYLITIPTGVKYIRISIAKSLTNVSFGIEKIYTYAFPQSAGTVYGGTLTIHQDGTGLLKVKTKINVYDGSSDEEWSYSYGKLYLSRTFGSEVDQTVKGISNMFKWNNNVKSSIGQLSLGEISFGNTATNYQINVYPYGMTSASDFTTYLATNNLQVMFFLAEPQQFSLTAQQVVSLLKGQNVLWSTTGNTAIEYAADTKLYIDGKIAELQALILES